jgi:UDP-GlcNAc:undecaprenyl-phosphate GlcNAc-1-phosphate transferase
VSRRRAAPRSLVVGAITATASTLAWSALQQRPPSDAHWQRSNYRGRDVTLLLGPAVGVGALAGIVAARPSGRRGALLAVASAAAVGAYDDLYGDRHARGLRGHARALREGRVTTGMVKLAVLAGTAALGSSTAARRPVDVAVNTVLVAGGANLINLFDLRPGRAAKVSLLAAAALGAGGTVHGRAVAAVAAGAALAALPSDLGERAMLGDCGAGALGAVLGWSAGVDGSRRRRGLLAASVVAITVASERVSFSEVIERQPALRALDRLGRRP